MLTSRPLNVVRMMLLAAVAAIAVGIPAMVGAQTPAPAPAANKASWTATKRHAKAGPAEEQSEMNERLRQMTQRLKLTDDQVAKVKSIFATRRIQGNELRAKFKGQPATSESKAAMEKAHQDLRADTDGKLAQVLTPEQMTEFKEMRAEHKKHEGAKEEKEEEAKDGKK